jgi:hypothetical protein
MGRPVALDGAPSPGGVDVRSRVGALFVDRATALVGERALSCPGAPPTTPTISQLGISVRWLISRRNTYTGRCADRPRAV